MKPSRLSPILLTGALLLGGLRDPLLFGLGGACVWLLVWLERPALGPAAAWLAWLAWAALSAVLSAQPWAALPSLARWSAAVAFASLAASWDACGRQRWLQTAGAAAAVLAAAALVSGARGGFGPTMVGFIPPYYNYSAFALAAAAAGGAALALHARAERPARLAGGAVAFVGTVCVVLAHSRGASLGLAFAGAVWAARRWGVKAIFAAAAAAALGAAAFQADYLPSTLRAVLVKQERRYREVRPHIWRAAALVASEKPLFGEGPGSFSVGFRRHPVEAVGGAARWGLYTDYAHSEPLQAAAETGWIGLALWLLGFGACLSVLLGPAQEEPAREAAAAAVAAMAAQLAVDNMLQIPGLAMLFLSASAVAAPRPAGPRRWPGAAMLAGGVLALAAWMPRALAEGNPGRAVALFPAEAERHEELAYRVMAAGKAAEADAIWSRAEALSPFNAIYPWQRARIAAAQKLWAQAESLARRAAELEPDFLNDRVLRAEALLRLGRTKEAREELKAVLHERAARVERPATAPYDEAIREWDGGEFDRVAALVGG